MKPPRSRDYLDWIRSLPCIICNRPSEAAHVGTDGGMAMKASDFSAVPVCIFHHRYEGGRFSYHRLGRKAFEAHYRIDLQDVVAKLNRLWKEERQAAA